MAGIPEGVDRDDIWWDSCNDCGCFDCDGDCPGAKAYVEGYEAFLAEHNEECTCDFCTKDDPIPNSNGEPLF